MSTNAIHFTQEQARDLADVSPGHLRAWRKAVPYLAGKPGKAARYSFSDLIGLAITGEMVRVFHVRISDVGGGIDVLFHALSGLRPPAPKGHVVLLDSRHARVIPLSALPAGGIDGSMFLVPCDPILARVGHRVWPADAPPEQASLPFPPQAVKTARS